MPEARQQVFDDDDRARVGGVHFEANFGLLTIDWSAQSIELELRIGD